MLFEEVSRKRKALNWIQKNGMNVYVGCITIESLIYLFFMAAYFLEVSNNLDTYSDNVDYKTIIMTLLMVVSMYSIYTAITKVNVYALQQFLVLQSALNYCIYFRFISIMENKDRKFSDKAMQQTIVVFSVICVVLAIICQILFYIFAYSIYKNNQFKIYNRVGAIPSNIRGYCIYKTLKNLTLTFMQLFVINNVLYYIYLETKYELIILIIVQIIVIVTGRRILSRAIVNENARLIMISIAALILAQIYKCVLLGIFFSNYNWKTDIYQSSTHPGQTIFSSTVILNLSLEIVNTLVVVLLVVFSKFYLELLGTGLKEIINPQLANPTLKTSLIQ